MTWAQGTFAFCFGILTPAVGVLCAARLRRERKSWIRGFLLGSATTFLALVVCCFIAHFCFPRYPNQRIPEPLANAFTLPGVAAGIAAVWFVSAAHATAKRFCVFGSVLVVVLYVGGLALCYETFTWRFRKELPWSAHDVHEWYMSDTLLPDYSYQLKAQVTEDQFRRYITRFGLTPHTPTRSYSDSAIWLSWNRAPGFEGGWWDPSASLDSTFVWQGYDTWTFAKFENGYLYLASVNH
jgi:hypothetical protein